MHGWLDHTIKMKSRKETIETKITLIDNENSCITRALIARLPTVEV